MSLLSSHTDVMLEKEFFCMCVCFLYHFRKYDKANAVCECGGSVFRGTLCLSELDEAFGDRCTFELCID